MSELLQDLRYGLSSMLMKPALVAMALAALVLGIGANTAIFSVLDSVLLRPLPYPEAGRLVRLHDAKPPELEDFPVSPGNFTHWQEHARSFEQIGAYYASVGRPLVLTGGAQPEQLDVARVSASLFPLLRATPILGRGFAAEEEERGRDQVVILSHAMWQRRFGANPAILGRSLTLSDKPYTIVGVMPASFAFPSGSTQAWVPLGFTPRDRTRHGTHYLTVLARLERGVAIRQAQAEMDAIAHRLARQNPETNGGWRTDVVAWQEDLTGAMRAPLLILGAAVVFVLLIACLNVTNLLLARGASRSREVAIRMALGASRARVARQLLTESVLLSLTGGALGSLLAFGAVKALTAIAPETLPASVSVNLRALAFTVVVSVVTGVLFGLAPAIQLSRPALSSALKDGARGATAGRRRQRVQKLVVVLEVALSLVLVVGAGLLIRSFTKLRAVDAGLDPKNVLTMNVSLPKTRYPEDAQQAAYFQKAVESLAALPGVESAAALAPLPFDGSMNYGFSFEGRPPVPAEQMPVARWHLVSPRYFEVMGVRLLHGRAFTDRDRDGAPRVAIINGTMAKQYFPNENPVGKRIWITSGAEVWREIVGVVADVRESGLETEPEPQVYEPLLQEPMYAMTIAVRARTLSGPMAKAIVDRVMAIDKDQPVTEVRTMESVIASSMARRRFAMTLLSLFAAVALILAATGIYGVMSYAVSQRTHEIGIRMSVGARTADVLRLVVGEGAKLVMIGIALGLTAALTLTRAMHSLLFGVTATDLPTYASVATALTTVALLATWLPARRAAKLDPLAALRQE